MADSPAPPPLMGNSGAETRVLIWRAHFGFPSMILIFLGFFFFLKFFYCEIHIKRAILTNNCTVQGTKYIHTVQL